MSFECAVFVRRSLMRQESVWACETAEPEAAE